MKQFRFRVVNVIKKDPEHEYKPKPESELEHKEKRETQIKEKLDKDTKSEPELKFKSAPGETLESGHKRDSSGRTIGLKLFESKLLFVGLKSYPAAFDGLEYNPLLSVYQIQLLLL